MWEFLWTKWHWDRFYPISFIPSVLHYLEKLKNLIVIFLFIYITELHNKPQGCGASVASAAGPFTTKKKSGSFVRRSIFGRACPHAGCFIFKGTDISEFGGVTE
jgi:hypothetical protein